jgi:hypothetical protein
MHARASLTDYGEERATRLVCTNIQKGLWHAEIDLAELPSAMTKQGIYQGLCYVCGHKIKSNAFSLDQKLGEYPVDDDFTDIFLPLGSEPFPV